MTRSEGISLFGHIDAALEIIMTKSEGFSLRMPVYTDRNNQLN